MHMQKIMKISPGRIFGEDLFSGFLQETRWEKVKHKQESIGITLGVVENHWKLETRKKPMKVERNESSADHQS